MLPCMNVGKQLRPPPQNHEPIPGWVHWLQQPLTYVIQGALAYALRPVGNQRIIFFRSCFSRSVQNTRDGGLGRPRRQSIGIT